MKNKTTERERSCGNCRYHNMYEYPNRVFCFVRFQKRKNPIVPVLDCCDEWESKLQECFCLDAALGKQSRKSK